MKTNDVKLEQATVVAQLWKEFDRLNALHFEGKLTLSDIRFSTRKQYGGYYRKSQNAIVISWAAHVAFGWEETMNTFRHEVAHLVHWNHTKEFWELAVRLGSTQRYARVPENREHGYSRYIYECPVCKARVFRKRRLVRSSCARCDRKFNPDYLLKLVSSSASRPAGKR